MNSSSLDGGEKAEVEMIEQLSAPPQLTFTHEESEGEHKVTWRALLVLLVSL